MGVLLYYCVLRVHNKGNYRRDMNAGNTKGDMDIAGAKRDARKCLEDLATAHDLTKRLQGAEAVLEWEKVAGVCDSLSDMCPMYRVAHAAKAKELNKLGKWSKAKT